jgi:hypothetical protein
MARRRRCVATVISLPPSLHAPCMWPVLPLTVWAVSQPWLVCSAAPPLPPPCHRSRARAALCAAPVCLRGCSPFAASLAAPSLCASVPWGLAACGAAVVAAVVLSCAAAAARAAAASPSLACACRAPRRACALAWPWPMARPCVLGCAVAAAPSPSLACTRRAPRRACALAWPWPTARPCVLGCAVAVAPSPSLACACRAPRRACALAWPWPLARPCVLGCAVAVAPSPSLACTRRALRRACALAWPWPLARPHVLGCAAAALSRCRSRARAALRAAPARLRGLGRWRGHLCSAAPSPPPSPSLACTRRALRRACALAWPWRWRGHVCSAAPSPPPSCLHLRARAALCAAPARLRGLGAGAAAVCSAAPPPPLVFARVHAPRSVRRACALAWPWPLARPPCARLRRRRLSSSLACTRRALCAAPARLRGLGRWRGHVCSAAPSPPPPRRRSRARSALCTAPACLRGLGRWRGRRVLGCAAALSLSLACTRRAVCAASACLRGLGRWRGRVCSAAPSPLPSRLRSRARAALCAAPARLHGPTRLRGRMCSAAPPRRHLPRCSHACIALHPCRLHCSRIPSQAPTGGAREGLDVISPYVISPYLLARVCGPPCGWSAIRVRPDLPVVGCGRACGPLPAGKPLGAPVAWGNRALWRPVLGATARTDV